MWMRPNSVGNTNFTSAVNASKVYRPQPNRNTRGTFGRVTKIGGKYVKKFMDFRQSNNNLNYEKIFMNEVRVGSLPGMFPRIYAWKIKKIEGKPIGAEYIMDDFRVAPPGYKVVLMREYLSMKYGIACPAKEEPVYQEIKDALVKFWKASRGYHGDLHIGNMAVMYKEEDKSIKKVIIFDYGSHRRFKSNMNQNMCFEKFIKLIDKEFNKSIKNKRQGYFPPNTKILAVRPHNGGQLFRSNANMLRGLRLTQESKIINKNFKTSMMSAIHPTNKPLVKVRIPKQPNELLELYKQTYPNKTNDQVIRAIVLSFRNFNYNKNKAQNILNFPNMSKENYNRMLNNLRNREKKIPRTF